MKRQLLNVSAAALLAVFAATMMAAPVFADAGVKTRWVDIDGQAGPTSCESATSAFAHVQAAIIASDRNDRVLVCPGTYTENVTIKGLRDGLRVISVVYRQATIVAPAIGPVSLVRIRADDVAFQGFRLEAPTVAPCRRVVNMISSFESADGTVIDDNIISPAGTDTLGDCGYDFGIVIVGGAGIAVRGNIVRDFGVEGISVQDGAIARVIGNSIRFYHRAEPAGKLHGDRLGIAILSAAAQVRGNRIIGLTTAGSTTPLLNVGILLASTTPSQVVIRHNITRWNFHGLVLSSVSDALLVENRSRFNAIFDCYDSSTGGTGTAGTDNIWIDNVGDPAKSDPEGICSLPSS